MEEYRWIRGEKWCLRTFAYSSKVLLVGVLYVLLVRLLFRTPEPKPRFVAFPSFSFLGLEQGGPHTVVNGFRDCRSS